MRPCHRTWRALAERGIANTVLAAQLEKRAAGSACLGMAMVWLLVKRNVLYRVFFL